ncbi:MAG: YqeG family HAD IIIA-type phosphatase [Firmicutes bacterium]|nr:YqeG family HAD IIIA-type phosphatase [Bacillota bacterium]
MPDNSFYYLLCPHLYLSSVFDLPIDQLKEKGICGLIFDLDNTLLNWNMYEVTPEAKALFARLQEAGFRSCLVSNNKRDRVEAVAKVLGLPAISKARKPRRKAFRQAMLTMGTTKEETAVIGDQLFTDVLGGNRLELYTILVVPLSNAEFIGTKVMRSLERFVLARLIQRGLVEKPVIDNN